jgi:hypothetical protein
MKKHYKLIKLILAAAGLVALGVAAFKFMYKKKHNSVKVQSYFR